MTAHVSHTQWTSPSNGKSLFCSPILGLDGVAVNAKILYLVLVTAAVQSRTKIPSFKESCKEVDSALYLEAAE